MTTPESEARKALNRLRRAAEKGIRELETLTGALRSAEGEDFPAAAYGEAEARLRATMEFVEDEGARLRAKVLASGGLEPGRVRRSTGSP